MLLGELPELEETQSGKDLIRIGEERGLRVGEERGEQRGLRVGEERGEQRGLRVGEERGEQRGLQKAILVSLRARYGTVPAPPRRRSAHYRSRPWRRVLEYLPQCPTLEAFAQWLAGPGSSGGSPLTSMPARYRKPASWCIIGGMTANRAPESRTDGAGPGPDPDRRQRPGPRPHHGRDPGTGWLTPARSPPPAPKGCAKSSRTPTTS